MAALAKALTFVVFCLLIGGSLARSYHQNDEERLYKREESAKGDEGQCQKPMDLLFILDSSESVGALNWEKIINFTRKVAGKFDVQYTRVGVIQYHSTPEVPIALSSFKDNKTLDEAISNIYFKPGATRTDLAIMKAIEVFNKAPLRKASRVVLFVIGARSTDLYVSKGKSINATDLIKQPSANLQGGQVAVYAAAVSEGLPANEKLAFTKELNILTSTPPIDHIFESPTYDDLLTAKVDEVAKKTCVVNGGMSKWSSWSTCSVTCGTGTRVRMRTCNNPKPENSGLPCTESTVESGECSVEPCPGTPNPSPVQPNTASSTVTPVGNYSIVTTPIAENNVSNSSLPSPPPSPNVNVSQPLPSKSIAPSSSQPGPSVAQPKPLPPVANVTNPSPNKNSSFVPNYNLTNLENAGAKPGKGGSPWPPSPTHCKPHLTSVYGYPDYKICGNGFELITLAPHQLTASSTYSKDSGDSLIKARHAAYNAVLNNTQNAGAWCAEHQFAVTQDNSQYLSIDLGQPQLIGKVATQGMEHWDNWVSTYSLKFSNDNIDWYTYERTLQGNCDRRSTTENILNPPVNARFIRVNPLTWYTAFEPAKHDICLRVGIYKCRDCKLVPMSRCHVNAPSADEYFNQTETQVNHLINKVTN